MRFLRPVSIDQIYDSVRNELRFEALAKQWAFTNERGPDALNP